MLLKAGIAMMSAALLMAAGVFVFVFLRTEEPVVAATEMAEKTPEPMLRYGEPHRVAPEKTEEPAPKVKAEEVKPEEMKPEPELEPTPEPAPAPEPEPEPSPKQEPPPPEPSPEPEPEPVVVERVGEDWPAPTGDQVAAANAPRRYELAAGAVMGLTVKALGIYNVPVFSSDAAWALDSGVAHDPATSMPWSGGAQRNVYLEGHRLGYPGTGSHLIFYNLDQLGRGDEVLLKNRDGKRYTYRVIDAFVVNPSDSWVMGQVRGRDLVTLQTCTNAPAYDKRLIVRAERV